MFTKSLKDLSAKVLDQVWATNLRSRRALYFRLLAGQASKADRALLRRLENMAAELAR